MTTYTITNPKTPEMYQKDFENETEARHWIINNLDLSLNWTIDKENREEYNGWANKATWLVKLWIDNDEIHYHKINNLIKRNKKLEVYEVAAKIQDYVETDMLTIWHDGAPVSSGLQIDLLNWAIAMVNWDEITKVFLEDNN